MGSADLRVIVRIKHMAEAAAAADIDKSEAAAIEAMDAYTRLREQARKLNERAGWDAEEFDQEVPFAEFEDAPPVEDPRTRAYRLRALNGPRAVFLLRQLAAWAAGYAEVFEIEARLKADAAAKAQAAASRRGPTGFSPPP
jgi:hypothetical protein